ncbi:hypothetical protein [Nitrosomonas sp.]|uniref:hypothetical protein n=1 Tax=Nitrosomonas sp. TaxID=42353 RepID=UPI00260ECAA2|nr:hypothetical protein [Nitrosomonas sp.]MCW5602286.1 hypothetical protein [Nitrosomonas sp.]
MARLSRTQLDLMFFGQEIKAESARSLSLLKDIESTLSFLNRLVAQLHADIGYAEESIKAIENLKNTVDPDESISTSLEEAQEYINLLHNLLISKRQTGRDDTRLKKSDGIEEAYTKAIDAAAYLHNLLNYLRRAVNEQDARFIRNTGFIN